MYTDTKVANATPKVPILSTNINKEIILKRDEVNVEMKASFDRLNAFIAARMIDSNKIPQTGRKELLRKHFLLQESKLLSK